MGPIWPLYTIIIVPNSNYTSSLSVTRDVVENGSFVPPSVVIGVGTSKIKSSWNDDDKKKVIYDKKAKNLLQEALSMDEFFRVSLCKTMKEIWDMLEFAREETVEVKRSKLNTLSKEYEMFRMQPR